MPLTLAKNTKATNNIAQQVAKAAANGTLRSTGASAIPLTQGVQQLSNLSDYINGGTYDPVGKLEMMYQDAKIDPEGWNKESFVYGNSLSDTAGSSTSNVNITNDYSTLANAISSAAKNLGNVYQGYVNAQAAAANAANAASKEAQDRQYSYNKALMDLQNQETRSLMQWQMDYNTTSAKAQRDWEERMSNTAYQRAVQDLKAAGLNPILAYTNGAAQTPSGATASPVSGSAAGSSVGTYSGASYHINDTMAMMGATLGVIGQMVNSAKFQNTTSTIDKTITNVGDSIVAAFKTLFAGMKYK